MNFSQRKKLILVVFGLLVIAVLGFFVVQPNSSNYESLFLGSSLDGGAQRQAFNAVTKRDADNDGLKDWEEELWGTNPNDKDTDADGTNDGDEINQNRNPLKAGPDDVLDTNVLIAKANISNTSQKSGDLTATDKFSQDFFEEYLLLKGSSTEIDEYSKSLLVESAISNILDTNNLLVGYTDSDLDLSENIDESTVKDYGNTLGGIIIKYSFETENELEIFNKSLSENNPKEIEKLDPIIDGYSLILRDALAIEVPKDVSFEHISFLESISSIIDSTEGLRAVYSDPIKAIVAIEKYKESVFMLGDALERIKIYFTNKGVVFGSNEMGIVLTNNI